MKQTRQEILNQQIANWMILYVKLHDYHWNVKGSQFFTLHAKFEELYTEAALHIDTIAERLLMIGGKPVAQMQACLQLSAVEESKVEETAEQMVATIAADFELMIAELKHGVQLAQSEYDETTADMLLSV